MDNVSSSTEKALAHVARRGDSYVKDLLEFVSISSVSTQPERQADVLAAARWTAGRLERAGIPDVRTLETAGHPVVVGRLHHDASKPTVIVYAHYDVQPAEPLELWRSPPFEPEVRDGKVYGRGSCDDKAGLLTVIQAVEAYTQSGEAPPVNVTFLFEGEEEIGSPNLAPALREHADLLRADLAVCADGGIFGVGIPSVTVGSRGLVGAELVVEGASADLHSGTYGGVVANPVLALARVIASFHDEDGRVLVEGFEDGVPDLTPALRRAVAKQPLDEGAELDEGATIHFAVFQIEDVDTYYERANLSSTAQLRCTLHEIIKGHVILPYGWPNLNILEEAPPDVCAPGNTSSENYILDIYRILYVRGYNVSKALGIIEADIPVSDERDEIISFIRDTGRGIMRGYTRRIAEDMP